MAGKNLQYLTVGHYLQSRVKDVLVENDLRLHVRIDHSVKTQGMTKREVAKYHLLAHTLEAFPELQELMDNS